MALAATIDSLAYSLADEEKEEAPNQPLEHETLEKGLETNEDILNLDAISVAAQAEIIINKLKEQAAALARSDHLGERLYAASISLSRYIENISIRNPQNIEDQDAWKLLGEQDPTRQAEIGIEYRNYVSKWLSLPGELLNQNNDTATLLACKIIQAATSYNNALSEEDASGLIRELGDRGLGQRVVGAVNNVAAARPLHFHEYLEKNGPDNETRETDQYVVLKKAVETIEEALPATGETPRFTRKEPFPPKSWDNMEAFEEKVQENIKRGFVKAPIDLTKGVNIERRGLFNSRYREHTAQFIENHEEWVTLIDSAGKMRQEKVKVTRFSLYEEKLWTEIQNIKPGTAHAEKDTPIKILRETRSYSTIVEAVDGLKQLEKKQKLPSGDYKVPVLEEVQTKVNGRTRIIQVENWRIQRAAEVEKLERLLRESVKSFEKAGLNYNEEKGKIKEWEQTQRKVSHDPETWISNTRASLAIEQQMDAEIKRLTEEGRTKQAEHLKKTKDAFAATTGELAIANLHVGTCEKMAADRLIKRGLVPGSANWELSLRKETQNVYEEMQEKAVALQELAEAIYEIKRKIELAKNLNKEADLKTWRGILLNMTATINLRLALNTNVRLEQIPEFFGLNDSLSSGGRRNAINISSLEQEKFDYEKLLMDENNFDRVNSTDAKKSASGSTSAGGTTSSGPSGTGRGMFKQITAPSPEKPAEKPATTEQPPRPTPKKKRKSSWVDPLEFSIRTNRLNSLARKARLGNFNKTQEAPKPSTPPVETISTIAEAPAVETPAPPPKVQTSQRNFTIPTEKTQSKKQKDKERNAAKRAAREQVENAQV